MKSKPRHLFKCLLTLYNVSKIRRSNCPAPFIEITKNRILKNQIKALKFNDSSHTSLPFFKWKHNIMNKMNYINRGSRSSKRLFKIEIVIIKKRKETLQYARTTSHFLQSKLPHNSKELSFILRSYGLSSQTINMREQFLHFPLRTMRSLILSSHALGP